MKKSFCVREDTAGLFHILCMFTNATKSPEKCNSRVHVHIRMKKISDHLMKNLRCVTGECYRAADDVGLIEDKNVSQSQRSTGREVSSPPLPVSD